jgi:hypothetical protein
MAVSRDGVLYVVVVEHSGDGDGRLVVVRSHDRGTTLEPPVVVDRGPDVAESIKGLGGFIAPLPAVATSADGSVAVSWSTGRPGGAVTSVFETSPGGTWRHLTFPDDGVTTLFPALAYDISGRLWLLVGRASDGILDYELRSRGTDWSEPVKLGGGAASRFIEIGEALGLVSTPTAVIAAFPIDSSSSSSIVISRSALPSPPTTTTGPHASTYPGHEPQNPAGENDRQPYLVGGAVLAVASAAGTGLFLLSRSRRR